MAVCMLCLSAAATQAKTVYYDNTITGWATVKVHFWGGNNPSPTSWAGMEMTKVAGYKNLYSYDIGDNPNCIFNNDGNGKQTPDLKNVSDGFVCRITNADDCSKYTNYTSVSNWENTFGDSVKENLGGGDSDRITIYYDNGITGWGNVYLYSWTDGSGTGDWPGVAMTKVAGYDNLYSFKVGANWDFNINNQNNGCQTSDLNSSGYSDGYVIRLKEDGYKKTPVVYTSIDAWKAALAAENQGSGGEGGDESDVQDTLFWTVPATPKANEEFVFHLNAAKQNKNYSSGQKVSIYTWVPKQGEISSDTEKEKWGNQTLLMTQDSNNPNHFTYTITNGAASFFNLENHSGDIAEVGFIAREYNYNGEPGDNQKIGGNCMVTVTPVITPPGPASSYLGAVVSYATDGDNVSTINCENGILQLTPFGNHTVKVFTLPDTWSSGEERTSISVVGAIADAMTLALDTDEQLVYQLSGNAPYTYVIVDKATSFVSFAEGSAANISLAENAGLRNSKGSCKVSFQPMGDAAFYGGGYNGGTANLDNCSVVMNNTQTGGWEAGNGYDGPHNICVPFVISTSGYGILFDDHYRGATIKPSSTGGTSYSSGSQNPIAYYYVGGGDMETTLGEYTNLTGRQQMPPFWALGYHTSRYGYKSFSEAEGYINDIKNCNIPIDGVVFDLFWQGARCKLGTLDWGTSEGFSGATEWLAKMKNQGVHTTVITEPFFTSQSANYNFLKDSGYFADLSVDGMGWLDDNTVGLIDASNPEAMAWMGKQYDRITQDGVDGQWMDLGEPERHDYDSTHKGGSVDQVHNEFGNLWVESCYSTLREKHHDMRPFIMPRAATSGMQRFSAFPWTGDIKRSWGGLQAQAPALISSSMSGLAFLGSDVGGFNNGPTENAQLYLRWIEMSTFAPMMRTHADNGDKNPEPSSSVYAGICDDIRKFINLRYRYLPYLYTLAWENTSKGVPMARPICMYDADPSKNKDVKDEWLWGKDMLVAPVLTDNATSRNVTFPDGKWINLNDNKTLYDGGTTKSVSAPQGTLPYFARLNSFIPHYSATSFTNTKAIPVEGVEYTVDVYVDNESEEEFVGWLFEDDRTTPSDNEGYKYLRTRFAGKLSNDGTLFSLTIGRHTHEYDDEWGYQGDGDYDKVVPNVFKKGKDKYHFIIHNWKNASQFNQLAMELNGTKDVEKPAYSPQKRVSYLDENEEAPSYYHSNSSLYSSDSEAEMLSKTEDSYYIDPTTNQLHLRLTLDPTEHNLLAASTTGSVPTGIDTVDASAGMYLEYVDGKLSYMVPTSMSEAVVEVYDMVGACIARFAADASGYVEQQAVALESGAYVARLTAKTASGREVVARSKFLK